MVSLLCCLRWSPNIAPLIPLIINLFAAILSFNYRDPFTDLFTANVFTAYAKRLSYSTSKFTVFFSIAYKLAIIAVLCPSSEYLINSFSFKIMFRHRWGLILVDNVQSYVKGKTFVFSLRSWYSVTFINGCLKL